LEGSPVTEPPHPRILAIANQKGGVGKTTTAINLGTALAAVGKAVLLIDADPQGNASTGLGVSRQMRGKTLYDVLMDRVPLSEVVVATDVPNLSLLPAEADLSGVELELGRATGRAFRLRDALANSGADTAFDYVLIDCPPSLNLLTVNALAAADAVLVPMQCEFFALEGLSQLLGTIEQVRAGLNPKLEIQGVVLTMFDRRNTLSAQVARDVRAHLKGKVYDAVIPRNVRVSEAPSFGKPALIYDLQCAGSRAYLDLAKEVIARERRAGALVT
jgi:chromosome partitioning protein